MESGLDRTIDRVRDELDVVAELLELDGKDILELGCGRAEKTRAIATAGRERRVLALEVDEVQHARNLDVDDLPNVRFELGGAQDVPAASGSFDVVFLFKSLHHVPVESMDEALGEIARVLRPGGLAYVSEPLFRGAFNDVLRIFHDEERVRREAFEAVRRAVRAGTVELVSQSFFLSPVRFADFDEFDRLVVGATHQSHRLSDETRERVRAAFDRHTEQHGPVFPQPVRVDLLRAPE